MIEALELDMFSDLYKIIEPFISMDSHKDEDVSDKVLAELREAAVEALGVAWPVSNHSTTQCNKKINI